MSAPVRVACCRGWWWWWWFADDFAVRLQEVAEDFGRALADADVWAVEPAGDEGVDDVREGAEEGDLGGRLGGLVDDGEGEEVGAWERGGEGREKGGRVGDGEGAGECQGGEELDCEGEQGGGILGGGFEDLGERGEDGWEEGRDV